MKQLDISCVSCIFSGYDENNTKKAIHFSTRSFNTTPLSSVHLGRMMGIFKKESSFYPITRNVFF